jgi:predicted nucleic acid-binding protein
MIVVADTSPLNYRVLIGEGELLYQLYGRVLIPPAVLSELLDPGAPSTVVEWVRRRPGWLEIRKVTVHLQETAEGLDLGESEAMALAEENRPDVLLLMDEERGRREARHRNLRTTGTLGVLSDAAERGLVDLGVAIQRLRSTSFRASDSLLQWLIVRDQQRKKAGTP